MCRVGRWVLLAALVLTPGCRKRIQAELPSDPSPQPVKILYPTAPGSFVKLVQQVREAVVQVHTDVAVRGGPGDWFPADTSLLSPLQQDITSRTQRSLGSGFIIDERGTVLTNAHVVAKAKQLFVQIRDGLDLKASVLGQDERSDLALLKVELPSGLKVKPLRLGNSDQLQPGEWVVALGNPFGLGPTVSAGVVSAREQGGGPMGQPGYWGYIQTDVAINPGNSGGPLCNVIGEVVGVATATEQNSLGLAVPISLAKKIMPILRRDGKIVRAWVGIYMKQVTPQMALAAGLKQPAGGMVDTVIPHGPADRAGLRAGDIITAFDGKPVARAEELPWLASLSGVGRQVQIKVLRDGKAMTFRLQTEPMPQ